MVVGGNMLDYEEDAGAPAASLLETKLLLNSVISEAHKGARFMTCDLKDFFSLAQCKTLNTCKCPSLLFPFTS